MAPDVKAAGRTLLAAPELLPLAPLLATVAPTYADGGCSVRPSLSSPFVPLRLRPGVRGRDADAGRAEAVAGNDEPAVGAVAVVAVLDSADDDSGAAAGINEAPGWNSDSGALYASKALSKR